jgi:phosphoribosylformimino-5-aminoimidazole carboxamide ribotide isomerase
VRPCRSGVPETVDLYCAIDLSEGKAVRLVQGDFQQRRDFGDPLDLARRFASGGAKWLHVVDLDAARTGEPVNRDAVLAVVEEASRHGASVQTGGGVRSVQDADALMSGGVRRVVLGTAAQQQPTLIRDVCARHPGRVAVAVDHRGSQVAVWGWEKPSGTSLADALHRLDTLPLAAVVITSIERDGMLQGPDTEALRDALAETVHPVIASGGVRSAQDLVALASVEARGRHPSGAIVGMALVAGTLALGEALEACATSV